MTIYIATATSNDDESDHYSDGGSHAVIEQVRPRLHKPPMYRVIMLNDDFTPMEFVVEVLEGYFGMNREQATRVMMRVHIDGKAVCGTYTRDIAETKASQVNQYARECDHPLLCEVESLEEDSDQQ